MRRAACVAALLLSVVLGPHASAQEPAAPSQPPAAGTGVMLPVPPLPTIGLPLPHIGLPDPAERTTPPAADSTRDQTGRSSRPPRRRSAAPPVFVYAPVIVGGEATKAPGVSAATPSPAAATRTGRTGTLAFDTKDDETPFLVFVDGAYLGSSDDLGHSLTLPAGSHEVEVQADGQASKRFTVRIAAGKTTTHETSVRAGDPASTPAGSTAAPATAAEHPQVESGRLYIIAGCYAGNVPPSTSTLPAGCDPSRVTLLER